jgi:pyrroline-5-carboxylate reductase
MSNIEAYQQAEVSILCVRPQAMAVVLEEIRPVLRQTALLSSIAAGLPIAFYERMLEQPVPFIRAMPTFFGRIKAGTTGLALNAHTEAEHLGLLSRIFDTVSAHVIVMPEDEMDAFTTFGSTTTATVYVLLDAHYCGLTGRFAPSGITSTCNRTGNGGGRKRGCSDKLPSQLLDELCTPGGVTVEGVKVLEERAMRGTVIDGVIAATERARQLGRSSSDS